MNFVTGTCSCSLIKFQVDLDKLKTVVNCHCNLCRKMNGASFSTYVVVLEDAFTMINGGENLKQYQVSADAQKCFCSNCGTPIYNTNSNRYNGLKILHLGTMSELQNFIPKANIYCESKLEWVDGLNSIQSFDQARTQQSTVQA